MMGRCYQSTPGMIGTSGGSSYVRYDDLIVLGNLNSWSMTPLKSRIICVHLLVGVHHPVHPSLGNSGDRVSFHFLVRSPVLFNHIPKYHLYIRKNISCLLLCTIFTEITFSVIPWRITFKQTPGGTGPLSEYTIYSRSSYILSLMSQVSNNNHVIFVLQWGVLCHIFDSVLLPCTEVKCHINDTHLKQITYSSWHQKSHLITPLGDGSHGIWSCLPSL